MMIMFKQHVCKQCYMSTTTTTAIHYDRDHSHSIISSIVVLGHWGMCSICTGYDVIIVCHYVIATRNVRMRLIVARAA